jgi:hypothetical protein
MSITTIILLIYFLHENKHLQIYCQVHLLPSFHHFIITSSDIGNIREEIFINTTVRFYITVTYLHPPYTYLHFRFLNIQCKVVCESPTETIKRRDYHIQAISTNDIYVFSILKIT